MSKEDLLHAIETKVDAERYSPYVPNCLICQVAEQLPEYSETLNDQQVVADHFGVPIAVVDRIFFGVIGSDWGDGVVNAIIRQDWHELGESYEGALQIAREVLS